MRGEGLAPSSVKMMHRLLVQSFRQAVKWQLIARNPVDAFLTVGNTFRYHERPLWTKSKGY